MRQFGDAGTADDRIQSAVATELEPVDDDSEDGGEYVNLRKCLLIGYYDNVAKLQKNGTYISMMGRQLARIHPSSVLIGFKPELIFYAEFLHSGQAYLKMATVIDDPMWMRDVPPLKKYASRYYDSIL